MMIHPQRTLKIGFDAKRAYHNSTGLGNYSRTLIRGLSTYYPGHNYYLFNPKPSSAFEIKGPNITQVLPSSLLSKTFPSAWRSLWLASDLKKLKIDLYHGLSHELPKDIAGSGVASVVTIHDLIFEHYPAQYNPLDVATYRKKFKYACKVADRVIAISQQTKKDLVNLYKVPVDKIEVCYQSCDTRFARTVPSGEIEEVKAKYALPHNYFLYVGSIIERKNLLNICKALHSMGDQSIPLVVIGDGKNYKEQVKRFISQAGIEKQVLFLSEHPQSAGKPFPSLEDFPAIYQGAAAMIYPSFFEGFGLPVLEALWSSIPVITSFTSCLPEAGGPGAFYVDPAKPQELAEAMKFILQQNDLSSRIEQGLQHAQKFTVPKTTAAVMDVYTSLL